MEVAGTDAATMETADMVLISDNLQSIVFARDLARHARRDGYQNLTFVMAAAMVVNIFAFHFKLPLPAVGVGCECSTVLVASKDSRGSLPPVEKASRCRSPAPKRCSKGTGAAEFDPCALKFVTSRPNLFEFQIIHAKLRFGPRLPRLILNKLRRRKVVSAELS